MRILLPADRRRQPKTTAVAKQQRPPRQIDVDGSGLARRVRQKHCGREPSPGVDRAAVFARAVRSVEPPGAQPPAGVVRPQAGERLLEHAGPLLRVKEAPPTESIWRLGGP